VAGVKFFNVYGPNEYHKEGQLSIVLASYEQIKTQGYVKLFKSADVRYGDGEYLRDFVYVKDCCDVLWWLVKTPKVNGIINLGTGFATTWNTMVRAVFDALGLEPRIEYVDMAENLRRQYQYFTQADMRTLGRLGYKGSFSAAPAAVHDYVLNYLEQPDKYL
jgi:ADP-L-glycero-D-manno-heptose 6-epimerase